MQETSIEFNASIALDEVAFVNCDRLNQPCEGENLHVCPSGVSAKDCALYSLYS
jgi:hypothetical protein